MRNRSFRFRWIVALFGLSLAFCFLPVITASAAGNPIVVSGETQTVDGDIMVTGEGGRGVIATNAANVTVNGSVSTSGDDSYSIYANGAKVTAKHVTATGSFNATAIDAENGATVSVDNVTAGTLSSTVSYGIQASQSRVTAGTVRAKGRDATGVSAMDGAVVSSGSVSAEGENAVGVTTYGSASANINGSVRAGGLDAVGVYMWENPTGTVRVTGDVSAPQGYGAVVQMISSDYMSHAANQPALVVEGTLSGGAAPLAIMPYYYDTTDWMGRTVHHFVYDLSAYRDSDFPTITVKNMTAGDKLISIVALNAAGDLVEIEGEQADALREAILARIQYMTENSLQAALPPQNTSLPPTDQTADTTLPPAVKATTSAQTSLPPTTVTTSAKTRTAVASATAASPQTGDDTNGMLWIVLLLLAGAGAAACGAAGLLTHKLGSGRDNK